VHTSHGWGAEGIRVGQPWLWLGCCGSFVSAAVVPWLLRRLGCCGSFASAAVVQWLRPGCYGCGALLVAGSGLAVLP